MIKKKITILFFGFLFTTLLCAQITDRATARQDYIDNYTPSSFKIADMQWTGNIQACNAGTVSQTVQNRIAQRINYFRRMVGVEAQAVLDQALNIKCQEAALMNEANNSLSHGPPNTWLCWTQAGFDGCASSNLAWGNWDFFNPIDNYMEDDGGGNEPVGHRRWILHSRGKTYANGITPNRQALWTFANGGNPSVFNNFIAFPPAGYIPKALSPGRWSFGHPTANFTNANVTMTGPNGNVPLTVIIRTSQNFGDNTLVWVPTGIDKTNIADVPYTVNITGVTGTSQSSYTYTATLFDPSVGGGGCTKPVVNQPTNQTVTAGNMTTAVNFTGTANSTYSWTNNNASIGLATSGTGNIAAFTATNAGATAITGSITVTPTLNGCVGDPKSFSITVNPMGGGGCTPNITVATSTTNGNTLAATSIMTQNTVNVNGSAVFSAPSVTLNSGFSVPSGNCFEANTVGCNYNGTLSCNSNGGGENTDGTCNAPHELTCGTVSQGNNSTGTNTWVGYPNGTGYTGSELIYSIVIPANSSRTITLSGLTADLDLIFASACNNTSILGASNQEGNTNESGTLTNPSGTATTTYLIIDGWQGATSAFSLSCVNNFTDEIVADSRNNKVNPRIELSGHSLSKKNVPTYQLGNAIAPKLNTLARKIGVTLDLNIHPNPFSSNTMIQYHLPKAEKVYLYLNDLTGKKVAILVDGKSLDKGFHQFQLDASNLNSGMYYLTMIINQQVITKKLVVNR